MKDLLRFIITMICIASIALGIVLITAKVASDNPIKNNPVKYRYYEKTISTDIGIKTYYIKERLIDSVTYEKLK